MKGKTTATSSTESQVSPRPGRIRRLLLVLGAIAGLVAAGFGGFVAWERFAPKPTVQAFTTAHSLAQDGTIVDETQVFNPGEAVALVFDLEGSRVGQTVEVHIAGGAQREVPEVHTYELQSEDAGQGAVTFTPSVAGTYTATLTLANRPAPLAQVTFEVLMGGPRLQQVTTARAIDTATFRPVNPATTFNPDDNVYITYRTINAAAGDTVKIRYSIDGMVQQDDPFDTVVLPTGGILRGHFTLEGKRRPLSQGEYRAELLYNDNVEAVVTFEVVP